jgi:hypothetical protein
MTNVEKSSIIDFHENPCSCSRDFQSGRTDGQTDRHKEINNCFLQICESV